MKLAKGSILVLIIYLMTIIPMEAKSIIPEVDQPRVGIVIDVIDGNALRVMYLTTKASIPEVDLILLSGVDTGGSDDAFTYTKQQLLGKPVFVLEDTGLNIESEFMKAFVFLQTNESFNETLLRFGYGSLEEDEDSMYYSDLVAANNVAKRQELGIYETSETPPNIININTASVTMMMEHFDVDYTTAKAIWNYRRFNPINDSLELGFVDDFFTRENIENYRGGIHYITDVNTGSLYELASLFDATSYFDLAYELDRERIFTTFDSLAQLKDLDVFDIYYDNIKDFLVTGPNNNRLDESAKEVVNINTASLDELIDIGGLSTTIASKILNLRKNEHISFYSIEELAKMNFPMQNLGMFVYSDEISVITDVNSADETELVSLFSGFSVSSSLRTILSDRIMKYRPFYSYDDFRNIVGRTFYEELEPYITLGTIRKDIKAPININTADDEEIINHLGLNETQQDLLAKGPYAYYDPSAISFITEDLGPYITLYTNINTANLSELLLMNDSMTYLLAKDIIEYRDYYPIYSYDELYDIFNKHNKVNLLLKMKDFIVYY